MIHPTAIIHPKALLDSTVRVGPFAVIDQHVALGANCVVGPQVHLTGNTTIGAHNQFHSGCVIGDAPQDLKYKGDPTRLRIGDHNVFREHVTVHRSNNIKEETVIGARNYLMANSHVGHNVFLEDDIVLANGALLAGHVAVAARAFISGNCLVHQFCRVGTLAFMQGGAAISMDLPPFTVASRTNDMCGLNSVGLRRSGFTPEERQELKLVYHALFRSGKNLRDALAAAGQEFTSVPAKIMLEFIAAAKRGVCSDVGDSRALRHDV
jgi:UDP-N-acetylglucosamine acyltransferase